MIDLLILFINTLYFVLGLVQFYVAPKLGPNPYLGFKIGYTFADREVWNKTNRMMGKFMIIHSLLLFPTAFIPDFLLYYLILFIVPLLAFMPFGIKYAATLLEIKGSKSKEISDKKLEGIKISKFWVHSPLILYFLLIIFEMFTYSQLPPVIAVHFDSSGNPNGWSDKNAFLLSYSLLSLIAPAFVYVFAYLGKRYPMYVHPGKMRFPRDVMLKMISISMIVYIIIFIMAYYSIYLYAIEKTQLSIGWFILLTMIMVMVPIIYMIYKWKQNNKEVNKNE